LSLFLTGTSKLFVEAKSQGTSLQEKHQNQLKEYLLLDNVDLGILTNGQVFEKQACEIEVVSQFTCTGIYNRILRTLRVTWHLRRRFTTPFGILRVAQTTG
jgi:hypothetical protein